MTKKTKTYFSDVVPTHAPQGANDKKWFLVEHQVLQAKMCLKCAIETLIEIGGSPENEDERKVALDCLGVIRPGYRSISQHFATFLSYLSGTDVPERISQVEV